MARINRHRTAIGRGGGFSRPVQLAMEAGLLTAERSFFDYGCGRGEDIALLSNSGIKAAGWDPAFRPTASKREADIVNLGYVVNVIEDAREREVVLRDAWSHARRALVVGARLTFDSRVVRTEPLADGCLTTANTFQKFYTQNELRQWITQTLGVEAAPAAPGVFFIFRDEELRQRYLAQRYRRRRAAPKITKSERLFEEHRDLLSTLIAFVTERARLPAAQELAEYDLLIEQFGSIKQAFAVIRRVTGAEQWEAIRQERCNELLQQLALERFHGRPRFSILPSDIQIDVREFFSSYKAACAEADALLFSVGDMTLIESAIAGSPIGKRTGNALYVHVDALHELPQILQIYEGCARAYLGSLEDANVIKLHRDSPRVSYLRYADFDRDPHPSLMESFLVKLGGLDISFRSYADYKNPPILHRKEELLTATDPRRERFERLTRQEERWGLYAEPERIGTRQGWEEVLREQGAAFRGSRLVRSEVSGLGDSVDSTMGGSAGLE